MKTPKKSLTEADWDKIFKIRCRSKRGELTTQEESAFCRRGFEEDPDRYGKMDKEVFEATKPFGA